MSIINDALKKLQNQIGQNDLQPATQSSDTAEKNRPTESVVPVMTEESSDRTKVKPEPTSKPQESHLVVVLVVLCLLTGLLLPVVNRQSLLVMFYQKTVYYFKQFQIARPSQPTAASPAPVQNKAPVKVEAPTNPVVEEPVRAPVAAATTPSTYIPSVSTVKKSPKPQSRLIINGIMTQGEKNVALIDGQIYEEGDTVDGIKLMKISAKGVTILEDGEERFVKVMGL